MRPRKITLTSANTPYVFPVDYRPEKTTLQATVAGTTSFTVEYTVEPVLDMADPATHANWSAVDDMDGATASVSKAIDASITCLKFTHTSGDPVDIAISQPEM